jgi:arsenate reductase (glutaredoxin)
MIRIYGIHNCDTTQKALKWLAAKGIPFEFHNYKEKGIDAATINKWLQHLPLNKVVNTRSTTYRELTDREKEATNNKNSAIALMVQHNSIIKRPLWDFGNGTYYLGWNETEVSKLI